MSDFVILRQMIKENATVPLIDHYDRKMVTLTEPQQSNSAVTIAGMPEDAIVIKADVFGPPNTVFMDSHGECKRADFVIIADSGDQKTVICIEMKAGKGGTEREIIQQLKGARCFVGYCESVGRLFWNTPDFLSGYEYTFVSIRDISVAKQPTRFDSRRQTCDRPEAMLKITGKRFEFKHLAGGH